MFARFLMTVALGCGVALVLMPKAAAEIDDEADGNDGTEVLARGPVHEAYASPIDGESRTPATAPKAAPEAIEELPPDQKPEGDNVQWIPGYWQWDEEKNDFIWVSGFWRQPPPGRRWVPGHYRAAEKDYQWVPGFWQAQEQAEVPLLPEPPATIDEGPATPPPADDSIYVPGCWVYKTARYVWRPGYFIDYRPGLVWIPAHYVWTPAGFVFVDGYWDLPLESRGLLFSPVCIDRRVIVRPGWCYTPRYVVSCGFLPTALFVRSSARHYYFGDYCARKYAWGGYTPWVDFRIGRKAHDPIFSYYRAANAGRKGWENDLRSVYVGRARGDIAPPPRTLAQQTTVVRNLGNNTKVDVKQVVAVQQLPRKGGTIENVKLAPINREERTRQIKVARENVEIVKARRAQEDKVIQSRGAAPRSGDKPVVLKIEPPKGDKDRPRKVEVPPPPPVAPTKKTGPGDKGLPGKDVVTPPPAGPVGPPVRKDGPPTPAKKDTPPPPPVVKKDVPFPPPTKKDVPPPPVVKKDVPPPVKTNVPPPVVKKETPPSPPPVKKDLPPPVVKKETPPPPAKRDVPSPPPPAKKETPPPPPPVKRDVPPPPPVVKKDVPPPPVVKREVPPLPPPRKVETPPPAPRVRTPPPAPRVQTPPPAPRVQTPPPAPRVQPPPPAPVPRVQTPSPVPRVQTPPPAKVQQPPQSGGDRGKRR